MSDTIPDAIAARAEAARIAEHQAALVSMQKFGEPLEPPDPVVVIDARLQAMVEVYDREWEEFDVEASVAFAASSARLWAARQAMVRRLEAEVPAAEAPKLTRADMNILRCLARSPDGFVLASHIPDGNGHTSGGGANGKRLSALRKDDMIRYGKDPRHSLYGFQITQRGLLYV